MLTRRAFLGTVSALAVSPVASEAAVPAGEWVVDSRGAEPAYTPEQLQALRDVVERKLVRCPWDDGDTILELR